MNVMTPTTSWRGHRDHILTRGSIAAKFYLAALEKLIAAILDKLGVKQTCLDYKFKVWIKGLFIFVSYFCLFFLKKRM